MHDDGSIDPRAHRVLAGASRVRVLEYLRTRAVGVPAAEVAEQVGLHPNTVRLHLDQLTDAGLVARTSEPPKGRGRPRVLYAAVASPAASEADDDTGDADAYRALAGILAGHFEDTSASVADEAAAVGRAWARSLRAASDATSLPSTRPAGEPVTAGQAAAQLVRVMDRLGFEASLPDPAGPVELHRCPFLKVAEQHSRVVCGVHLGLMQGALENLGAPLRATRLEPFVAPGLCLGHLAPVPDDRVPQIPTEGLSS